MSRREIVAAACKLLAVVLLATVVLLGSSLAGGMLAQLGRVVPDADLDPPGTIRFGAVQFGTVAIAGAAAAVLASIVLWQAADLIAGRIVGDDDSPASRRGMTAEDVVSLACLIIGVLFIIRVARTIVVEALVISTGMYPLAYALGTMRVRTQAATALVELLVAGLLILASRRAAHAAGVLAIGSRRRSSSANDLRAHDVGNVTEADTAADADALERTAEDSSA